MTPATLDTSQVKTMIDATVQTRMVYGLQGLHRVSGLPVRSSELEVKAVREGERKATFVVSSKAVSDPDLEISIHVDEKALRPPTNYSDEFLSPERNETDARIAIPRYACSIVVPKQNPE
ncbi:hypothetical protein HFO89_10900 [Rhizobium leguminosarum]|uniref:hypothetical protein n=1 Tax=Rhizobium leguminosarum TaxID=384 RepID=UPI001C948BC0|nr:hypothetical protein [Rhizobium leguminosarum]MBY5456868.1 hypothetical protein [Rhizobium leguminosarum]